MKEMKADCSERNSVVKRGASMTRIQSGGTAFQSAWLALNQIGYSSWKQNCCSSPSRPSADPETPKTSFRRIHTLHVSANGNGQEPTNIGSGNNGSEKPPKKVDPGIAKEKLVRIITELINDDAQIQEVEKLILQLEGLGVTPITEAFTEIGLAGDWKLLFSSTRTRPAKSGIRIRKIGQTLDTEQKQLINKASWSFTAKDGIHSINADLSVSCSYKFVGPGRFDVTVEDHKVRILGSEDGEKYELPDDLKELIGELQLALPIDFFDPSGLIDVSYMEPNFRLARFVGKRIAGVRNIFIRDVSDSG